MPSKTFQLRRHLVVTEPPDQNMYTMLCPECGDAYVAPISVSILPPGSAKGLLLVDGDGIHLDVTQEPCWRGVLIEVMFQCECGDHKFGYYMHFHKGQTFMGNSELRTPVSSAGVIWRD